MKALGIQRPFLELGELVSEWGDEADVRYALLEAAIVPSIFLDDEFAQVVVERTPAGLKPTRVALDGAGAQRCERLRGLYFLQMPYRTGALDGDYTLFTAEERPTENSTWWKLGSQITITEVLRSGVVFRTQLEAMESSSGCATDGLEGKTRASLLKMVATMAIDGYGFDPTKRTSPIPPQIAEASKGLGMALDRKTVHKYLYEAVERHLPVNWREQSGVGTSRAGDGKSTFSTAPSETLSA